MRSPSRRRFLGQAARAAGALPLAGPLGALLAREARGDVALAAGYGPLAPVRDETTGLPLLHLPAGFRYFTFGWQGDALDGGGTTPTRHDGMAAYDAGGGRVRLIRNHEIAIPTAPFAPGAAYDPGAGGGTVTLVVDPAAARVVEARASLLGTATNCAGGPTPWGSWLSCEETVADAAADPRLRRAHGFVFEVPASGLAAPEPLPALGRFFHEAIAIDPRSGIVYETEDRKTAGFYRFRPRRAGALREGGALEMLAVRGKPRFDTRPGVGLEQPLSVEWVPVPEPERAHADDEAKDTLGCFDQGHRAGGAVFGRLEGCWWTGARVVFTATLGGALGKGQVFELDPAADTLRLVYESSDAALLQHPDNLCATPRGGLVICEDGAPPQHLRGLTKDGRIFTLARGDVRLAGERNGLAGDYTDSELAGACFSPDGRFLFFNVHKPGFTVALTGPWEAGPL